MATVSRKLWSRTADGTPIYKYTLTNASGASAVVSNIGAAIVSINVPDRNGKLGDVVIGYGKAESYFADGPCAGKCPGRYANRIAGGRLKIAGKEYKLPINNGPNHLHGGPEGFQNKVWESRKRKGALTPPPSSTSPTTAISISTARAPASGSGSPSTPRNTSPRTPPSSRRASSSRCTAPRWTSASPRPWPAT